MDKQEIIKPTPIEAIWLMSNDAFASTYSVTTPPPNHFSDIVGFFTTNEYDYPASLNRIKVRGGLHVAIMGGIDPVLGQIAVANPDLTIMIDINPHSMQITTEGRIKPISDAQNAVEYWSRVKDFFRNTIKKINPNRWDIPTEQDSLNGGWSSVEHFSQVKEAVAKGKVKWATGDFTTDGIELALTLAKETNIPIRLIYVSNIFDYDENKKAIFAARLAEGFQNGLIDPNAQVIDTSSKNELKTQVYDIAIYIQSTR